MMGLPDMGLLAGESVVVITRTETGRDRGNSPIWSESETVVDDVLVEPRDGGDVVESNRPDGTEVAYLLHFPKTHTASLRGCRVRVRGRELHVVGDPDGYQPELTPGPWNRQVRVGRRDG